MNLSFLKQQAFHCLEQDKYSEAIVLYEECIEADPLTRANYWYLGLSLLLQGSESEAQTTWLYILAQADPEQIDSWTEELINILETKAYQYYQFSNLTQAEKIYQQILELNPDYVSSIKISKNIAVDSLQKEAKELYSSGNLKEAEQKYQEILQLDSTNEEAWLEIGIIYYLTQRYQDAIVAILQSLELDPEKAIKHYNLALVLEKLGSMSQAIQAYQEAIALNPTLIDAYNNLGNLLYSQGEFEQAELIFRQAIATNPNHYGAYLNLGNLLWQQARIDETIALYQSAKTLKQGTADIFNNLILVLSNSGFTQEAIDVANEAASVFPNDLFFRFRKHLILPRLYKNVEEIDYYREQFSQGLDELIKLASLMDEKSKSNALSNLDYSLTLPLAYQGQNDRDLQQKFGQLVDLTLEPKYSQFKQPLSMPSLTSTGKIRVGYISNNSHYTVYSLFGGWLKHKNRDRFEIYCYHPAYAQDSLTNQATQQAKLYSDVFHYFPDSLEAIAKRIISDRLHILVFLDIIMHPLTTQLAGLRLAPIQCSTWCHPITSGLQSIDYFLSSELMEPENGQLHYSEQLIKLPNIGISYPKPRLDIPIKGRCDFCLRDDAVVYLSCQSLFKYLPQYDYVFAAIAQQVAQSQFVFLAEENPYVTEQFRQRLERIFAGFGLNSEDYCVILPRQNYIDYLNLNWISDIFLDTLSWSGGNTALEAISCNLPIVTCPGEFMRGRHSCGILRMLGVTETIARNEGEYIEIAVRLGLDSSWRQDIKQKVRENHFRLYEDKACVIGLEDFYQQVIREKLG